MSCRNCKWLHVAPDKSGRRIARVKRMYQCTVEIPELPALPKCVSVGAHYGELVWPPGRKWMAADDGEGCQFWEQRK